MEFDKHEIVERHNEYPKRLRSLRKKYGTAKMRAVAEALKRSQIVLTDPVPSTVLSNKKLKESRQGPLALLADRHFHG